MNFSDYRLVHRNIYRKKLIELYTSYKLLNIGKNETYADLAGGRFTYVHKIDCKRKILHDLHFSDELKKLIETICLVKSNKSNNEKKGGITNENKQDLIDDKKEDSNDDKNNCSIYENKYILCGASQDIRDLRELSTVLNACGRLDKASIGLGLLLGDKKSLISAIYTLNEYKREILNGIKWIETRKRTSRITEEKGYIIINAEENISPKILGTITSMLSRNHELVQGTYLLALAKTKDNKTRRTIKK